MLDPFLRTDFAPWPILADDASFPRAPVRAWAESASVRGSKLGGGRLDLVADELAHGESLPAIGSLFNIQDAADAKGFRIIHSLNLASAIGAWRLHSAIARARTGLQRRALPT
jgi:hypothetical protein